MADLAIWMAGYVTVPVYPSLKPQSIRQILEHCGAKPVSSAPPTIAKQAKPASPPVYSRVVFPTAGASEPPDGDLVVTAHRPIAGQSGPPRRRSGHHHLHVRNHRHAEGSHASFAAFGHNAKVLTELIKLNSKDRVLSYLPLAHIVERPGMEGTAIYSG